MANLVKCNNLEHALKAADSVGGFVVIDYRGIAYWIDAAQKPRELLEADHIAAVCTSAEARVCFMCSESNSSDSTPIYKKILLMYELLKVKSIDMSSTQAEQFMSHAISTLLYRYRWILALDSRLRDLYGQAIVWRRTKGTRMPEKNNQVIDRVLKEINAVVTSLDDSSEINRQFIAIVVRL